MFAITAHTMTPAVHADIRVCVCVCCYACRTGVPDSINTCLAAYGSGSISSEEERLQQPADRIYQQDRL